MRKATNKALAAAGIVVTALCITGIGGSPASAHPHIILHNGQVLADGQNHGPFVNGVSCGGDPAAYGLETAHHGPDAGTPGNADGCYQTTGGVPPSQDATNPTIG